MNILRLSTRREEQQMSVKRVKSLLFYEAAGTPSGRIVRTLIERGPLSAREIGLSTGLAKSTVSTALHELRLASMVIDRRPANGRSHGVGRPATVVSLNPQAGTCVGLLIGAEHMQLIVADVSHAVLSDRTLHLGTDYSVAEAPGRAAEMLEQAYAELHLSRDTLLGVGIAVGGPVNPLDGRVLRPGGMPNWAGVDIRAMFEPVLQQAVFADNESNCSAIAEMTWGAAVGQEDFVFFTVDLGVGGAIVSHGRVVTGIAGGAGEFGHISIDPAGELCRCGNRGCLELHASLRRPLELASRRLDRPVDTEELIALALAGDVGCQRLLTDTAEAAGRGLAMVGSAINPGLVVLGGRAALAGELFMAPLEAAYDRHTLVKRSDVAPEAATRFVASRFSRNSACMGAVGMVLRHYGRRC
jgi:predicted NBD/HSP70 family sugar kinase